MHKVQLFFLLTDSVSVDSHDPSLLVGTGLIIVPMQLYTINYCMQKLGLVPSHIYQREVGFCVCFSVSGSQCHCRPG